MRIDQAHVHCTQEGIMHGIIDSLCIFTYCFEPESTSSLTVDDSSSSVSEMDIREQASTVLVMMNTIRAIH